MYLICCPINKHWLRNHGCCEAQANFGCGSSAYAIAPYDSWANISDKKIWFNNKTAVFYDFFFLIGSVKLGFLLIFAVGEMEFTWWSLLWDKYDLGNEEGELLREGSYPFSLSIETAVLVIELTF